jgi:hypothetical protein
MKKGIGPKHYNFFRSIQELSLSAKSRFNLNFSQFNSCANMNLHLSNFGAIFSKIHPFLHF